LFAKKPEKLAKSRKFAIFTAFLAQKRHFALLDAGF
jgi:hypothetical protein